MSAPAVKSRFRDQKKELVLNKAEQERREHILEELAKKELAGTNLNEYTHLANVDNK